jgi:hypothetical protein
MANVYGLRARQHVFEGVATFRPDANFNLIGAGTREPVMSPLPYTYSAKTCRCGYQYPIRNR